MGQCADLLLRSKRLHQPCLDASDQRATVSDPNSIVNDVLIKVTVRGSSAFFQVRRAGSTYEESSPAPAPGLAKLSVSVPGPELQLIRSAKTCHRRPRFPGWQ